MNRTKPVAVAVHLVMAPLQMVHTNQLVAHQAPLKAVAHLLAVTALMEMTLLREVARRLRIAATAAPSLARLVPSPVTAASGDRFRGDRASDR